MTPAIRSISIAFVSNMLCLTVGVTRSSADDRFSSRQAPNEMDLGVT